MLQGFRASGIRVHDVGIRGQGLGIYLVWFRGFEA